MYIERPVDGCCDRRAAVIVRRNFRSQDRRPT